MFRNYLKTAWRNLWRNKTYSFINTAGLTIGLCACMLVATVVIDDLSYDRQWSRSNDLFRIISVNKMGNGVYDRSAFSFAGLASTLRKDYPEVEAVTMMFTTKQLFKFKDEVANGIEVNALNTDTSFWKMLDIKIASGNPRKFVAGANNLMISESLQKSFFPNENPVGKTIYDVPQFYGKTSYLITGVMKDLPFNTVFRSDVILIGEGSKETLNKDQGGSYFQQYVLLKRGVNASSFATKLNKWYAGFVTSQNRNQFQFQPVKDVYLHSDFAAEQTVKSSYKNIYIFSGVALLLLLIACVNFINLSTAKAIERIKETGIRKVLGANRSQLVFQFLTESLLFFFIATVLSTFIYQLSLRAVESYMGHHLQISFVSHVYLLLIAYGSILLICVVTGLYPAWILSSYQPATTLKGNLFAGKSSAQNTIRKALVVFQFSMSVMVLIALIVVRQQVNFMKNKDIGYDKNNLMYIDFVTWDKKGATFKKEVLKLPGVVSASISNWAPTQGLGSMSTEIIDPQNTTNKINVWYINADADFVKTMGMRLQNGRLLSSSFANDMMGMDSVMRLPKEQYDAATNKESSLLTTYTAQRLLVKKLNEPIKEAKTNPVGIVADFNTESLQNPLVPTIIVADPSPQSGAMLIRTVPGSGSSVMTSIGKLWRQFYPEKLLSINWVDDRLADQYKNESKLQQLFMFFSSLSMLLAALGVFGLIVLATHQRIKEIGIRKVLGASVQSIVKLFSIDFIKLIMIAIIIASPIAYWLMYKWLLDYAYRIRISPWMFVFAGIFVLLIALFTLSLQTIKAAIANPVKSLRTD